MSDLQFLRLPVGEGFVRVKFDRAEWTPQKNKLILHPPIVWYVEQDPTSKGETANEVIMLDAKDVTEQITNPCRFSLAWSEIKGQPPVRTMGRPAEGAEPVTPEQGVASGGGRYKGGGGGGKPKLTREQLDQAIAYAVNAMDQEGVKESGLTADKVLGCAMFVDWPTSQAGTPEPEAPPVPDESDIPF